MRFIIQPLNILFILALSFSAALTNAQDISDFGPDMDINAAPSGIRGYLSNFDDIGAGLYFDVAIDSISFPQVGNFSRESLCSNLVDTFNNKRISRNQPNQYQNARRNSEWVQRSIPLQACIDALINAVPDYNTQEVRIFRNTSLNIPVFANFPATYLLPKVDFAKFEGIHRGTWYTSTGETFNNPVMWNRPTESTNTQGVITQSQTVEYLNRIGTSQANTVWGVNQSSSFGSAVAWNYDGKDNLNDGVILLFPFALQPEPLPWGGESPLVECAVLIKTEEAFLTCFNTIYEKTSEQPSYVRRAAAGFHGVGQWEIASRFDRALALNKPAHPNELIEGRDSLSCRNACANGNHLCQFFNTDCEIKEQVYPSTTSCFSVFSNSFLNYDYEDVFCGGVNVARKIIINPNDSPEDCTLQITAEYRDTYKFADNSSASRYCSFARIVRK
jgi:hypothetical protein